MELGLGSETEAEEDRTLSLCRIPLAVKERTRSKSRSVNDEVMMVRWRHLAGIDIYTYSMNAYTRIPILLPLLITQFFFNMSLCSFIICVVFF